MVAAISQLIGPNQSIKSLLKGVLDYWRDVKTNHPLWTKGVWLLNIVIGFKLKFPGRLAEEDCLGNIQVDRDGPLGAFPVVIANGRTPCSPAIAQKELENGLELGGTKRFT